MDGAFHFASLNDGLYRVEVILAGLKPATMQHLQLNAGEVTHASVAMRLEPMETITVGAIAPDSAMTNYGVSTTFTQDFINKLPR